MTIGITISLAGNPRMKAINITPSKPIVLANGSKAFVHIFKSVLLPTVILAISHIIRPAGADIRMALFKTKIVLSNIDLIITFVIWGFL